MAVPRSSPRRRRAPRLAPPPPSTDLVTVERRGPVAILTLNNPPVNILTARLLETLATRVLEMADDPSVRVLVLASAMPGFSGGADIKSMVRMDRAEASAFSTKGQAVANLLERTPLPVIVAVHGFCMGGGCELSQACDFILASEDAVFGQPEILIGVIPGWGGSRRLTRAVGITKARRWIMTGEKIPAAAALEFGLVDRVVPRAKLLDEAVALGTELARRPAVALAAAKYAVNQAADPSRSLGLEYERELWGLLFETGDQKEGMRAFLEKRPPAFPDQRDEAHTPAEFPWERPGGPLESARERVYRPELDGLPTRGAAPFDLLALAEVYRNAALRAFQAYLTVLRQATDSYQHWADVVTQRTDPKSLPTPARKD
jgi:enoyl-CoA hydratase